jgi:hypothetical protein
MLIKKLESDELYAVHYPYYTRYIHDNVIVYSISDAGSPQPKDDP